MFASLEAIAMESGLGVFALASLAGAVAAFLYIPLFGRPLAAGLAALACGLGAYDAGYIARGRLDDSAVVAAQLAESRREAEAAKTVSSAASARERQASAQVDQLSQKVADYERQLAERASIPQPPPPDPAPAPGACRVIARTACHCGLTAADLRGLRAIGGKSR